MMDWTTVLDRYGLPIVALLGTWVLLWKGGRWLGANVLLPLKDQHIAFLNTVATATTTNTVTLKELSTSNQRMVDVQSTQTPILRGHSEDLSAIRRHLEGQQANRPPFGRREYDEK